MKDQNGDDLQINFLHGTTTLGFVYKGGVILAVDSRATGGKNTYRLWIQSSYTTENLNYYFGSINEFYT